MRADVGRPLGHHREEPDAVSGVERARGLLVLLVAWAVSSKRGHEAPRRLDGPAHAVALGIALLRLLDETAERRGDSVGVVANHTQAVLRTVEPASGGVAVIGGGCGRCRLHGAALVGALVGPRVGPLRTYRLGILAESKGFETEAKAGFIDEYAYSCEPKQRTEPSSDDLQRGRSLAGLAAKARLLERLLTGDERLIATELREALEEASGPTATIIPFRKR